MKAALINLKNAIFIAILMTLQSDVSFSRESGTSSFSGIIDNVKRYCSEPDSSHSAQCLEAYLAYRCVVNHFTSDPMFVPDCISATGDLVQELDLTQVDVDQRKNQSSDPLQLKQVAFTKALQLEFMKNPDDFGDMIDRYEDYFDRSYRFNEQHSLWKLTYFNSGSSKEKALKTMVTLFQDFASPGYLQFLESIALESKRSNVRTSILANTRKFADFYIPLIENRIKKNNNPLYSIYPEIKGAKDMTPLGHHFYTPAYLALKLRKRGYSKITAFHAAFLFNTAYEFIKLDQKMKTKRWPLRDPLPFSAERYSLQAQKIYTGYLGALYGVGMSDQALNYSYFSKRLSQDPSGFVGKVHHSGF